MRTQILLTLFFLLPFAANAQLSGTYCNISTYYSSCFTFTPDRKFEHVYFDSTKTEEGLGTYKIDGKVLLLSFVNNSKVVNKANEPPTCKVSLTAIEALGDSTGVTIKVYHLGKSEIIPNANIRILSKEQKVISGIVSDYKGNASLSYPRSNDLALFAISSLGYANCLQSISLDKSYLINIEMVPGPFEERSGGQSSTTQSGPTWFWKIKKLNNSVIVLGGKGKKTVYRKYNSN